MKCERCDAECEFCIANWPWNIDFWICPICDSTYVFEEEENENKST